jgi:predicted phage-related endonuclease
VQNNTPPPKLSSDDYDLMFPDCESQTSALLSEEDTQIFDSYHILKQEEQDAINRRKDCEAKIKFLIGECEVAEHNGEKLATWKSQNSSRLDTTRLKQDYPEICEEYQKTANYRVLRVL